VPRPVTREVYGEELTVEALAELSGLTTSAVHARLNRGMTGLDVILTPKAPTNGVDMSGARFDKLTVIREAGYSKAGKKLYECQCDCGSPPKVVVGGDLRSGRTTSCGCNRIEATREARAREAEDLTGQTFADGWTMVLGPGELVPIKKGNGRVRQVRLWRCQCRCGKTFEAKAATLRKGQVTSCGCRRRALQAQHAKDRALRYDFFGEKLTLKELAEVSGVDGPTIRYRMKQFDLSAEQAAMGGRPRKIQSQSPSEAQ